MTYSSMAFLIYTFIVYLIHLYTASGRNAAKKNSESIELSNAKWYSRVPNNEVGTPTTLPHHVIGEDDEEIAHR